MKEFSLFTYVETKDANNTTLYNITILIISQEEVIGIRKSKNNRHIMAKRKRTKGQTAIYKSYT